MLQWWGGCGRAQHPPVEIQFCIDIDVQVIQKGGDDVHGVGRRPGLTGDDLITVDDEWDQAVLRDPKTKTADRIKSATAILERCGHGPDRF